MKTLIGAAIAIFAIAAPGAVAPVGAASASACTATSGVTVIVDFTHFGGKVERGCAPGHPADALDALRAAGFSSAGTAQYGDAFVCRIDALPKPKQDACAVTPSASAFWAFYSARPSDKQWTYSNVGVLDAQPAPGSIEAFAFGAHAQPSIPPNAAIAPPVTTTTKPTPPTSPRTKAPPVSPASVPPTSAPNTSAPGAATGATTTADVPVSGLGPTTTTVRRATTTTRSPAASTATRPHQPTTSTVAIVERSASGPTADGGSGSPIGVILTVAIVGGLAIGAFAFTARPAEPTRVIGST